MSADSLGHAGLTSRAPARGVAAADDGVFRSGFVAPTDDGVSALCADPLFIEWDALARRASAAPFLRPQWTAAWWRAFAQPGDQLALWYLLRNGRVAALVPMLHRGTELRVALNYHTPQSGLLAESPDAAAALLGALLETANVHEVVLPALDPLQTDADLCRRAAREAGYSLCSLAHEDACYLSLAEGWSNYETRLGGDVRSDLRRRRRRLQDHGEVRFVIEDGRQRLDALLDNAFAVEASGWKQRNGTAIRSDARVERFYIDIARWAAADNMLRLCFLRAGNDTVAMHFNLEHRGTWYLLKCGYDERFRQAAPGNVLQYDCIRHCFDSGMSRIEFCGDKDPHKLRWGPQSRMLERLHLFAPSLPGQLARMRVAARPWLKAAYARLQALNPLQTSVVSTR